MDETKNTQKTAPDKTSVQGESASALIKSPFEPKNKVLSTQRYLDFAGAHNETLVLKKGGVRAILEVSSVNFNLKSNEEQESIIMSYQSFLNALDFPVQILIKSKKLEIDHYLGNLRNQQKKLVNQLLRDQMGEYIEFIQKLVEYSNIMEKKFFVVIPMDPMRVETKSLFAKFLSYIRPDDTVVEILRRRSEFAKLKKQLETRVNVVQTALESCGLKTRRLTTEEIIRLLYQTYNPDISRSQKLNNIDSLSVSVGSEENIYEDR